MFMSTSPAHACTDPSQPAALADGIGDADVARYLAVLHELLDIGTAIARTVHREMLAEAASWRPGKPAVRNYVAAFDVISRAIRRTIMLSMKLAEPRAAARAVPERKAAPVLRVVADEAGEAARPRAERGSGWTGPIGTSGLRTGRSARSSTASGGTLDWRPWLSRWP